MFNFVQTQTLNNNLHLIGSTKVKNNSITLAGASIGFATGTSMYLLARITTIDGNQSFLEALVMILGPSFINGFIIPKYLESENKAYLRTGIFLSSFTTTFMPLLGPMFGAPNNDPSTVVSIIIMGAIGGAIWNYGFALVSPKYREALKSAKFKRKENEN